MERMVTLPEPNIIKYETYRVKKYNRSTYVLNGKFEQKIDMGNDIAVELLGSNFLGGQYKQVMSRKHPRFCDALWDGTLRALYNDLLKHSNMPPW